ncbi:MAG: hypothetical protein GWN30_26700 [Gammaproteobacteria bacterium]|nr:hypothetical protein [Gammaproteobacteria bacterium]NIX02581.1 hypothetical protein [Phycisphaerae bacterium]
MKCKESRFVFIAVLAIFGIVSGVRLLSAQENYIYTGDKRIETSTNIVRALYRINSRSYSGTPEEIARTYLQENRERLQIDGSIDQFKVFDIKESPAGHHVAFRQIYKGIPIWESETVVSINRNDQVTMMINGFQPHVDVISVPVVTKESAISLAANALGLSDPVKGGITELNCGSMTKAIRIIP